MDIYTILSLKEQLDDINKQRKDLTAAIKKYCESLDTEYLKTLDYVEFKEFFYSLENYLPKNIQAFYRKVREEKYPELKKSIYYPELNQIGFLSSEKIKTIDNLLGTLWSKKGNFIGRAFDIAAGLNKEESKKLKTFCCEKRIFAKKYAFLCLCKNCTSRLFSEEEFNQIKKYYESGIGDIEEPYIYIECEYDSENCYEIYDKKSFENAEYKIFYVKEKEPDNRHEKY